MKKRQDVELGKIKKAGNLRAITCHPKQQSPIQFSIMNSESINSPFCCLLLYVQKWAHRHLSSIWCFHLAINFLGRNSILLLVSIFGRIHIWEKYLFIWLFWMTKTRIKNLQSEPEEVEVVKWKNLTPIQVNCERILKKSRSRWSEPSMVSKKIENIEK